MAKTKQLTHWSDEVSDCDIGELAGITDHINTCLITAATAFVEIGHALNRARVLIPGDKEFGLWRAERTPFNFKQANNYMKVARKFAGHTLVAKTSMSILVELSSAPPEVEKKIEAKLDAGEKVTQKDVIKEKKDASLSDSAVREGTVHEPMTNKEFPQTEENNPFAPRTTHTVIESTVEDIQPPEVENTLPEGDYEMIAVTEDEFDLIIDALTVNGTKESLALAERLNR